MDELLDAIEPIFEIEGPKGDVTLTAPLPDSLTLIAAGTGAAQVASFLDALIAEPVRPQTTLYWSVATPQDLYLDGYFEQAAKSPWLTYRGFVDDRRGNNRLIPWLGEHVPRTDDVVLAGAPGFVYAAMDALVGAGLEAKRIRSDVFAYAPR